MNPTPPPDFFNWYNMMQPYFPTPQAMQNIPQPPQGQGNFPRNPNMPNNARLQQFANVPPRQNPNSAAAGVGSQFSINTSAAAAEDDVEVLDCGDDGEDCYEEDEDSMENNTFMGNDMYEQFSGLMMMDETPNLSNISSPCQGTQKQPLQKSASSWHPWKSRMPGRVRTGD